MKHARADYDRFQDPAGLIPDDEPVLLLRGQDKAAPHAARAWAYHARKEGASDDMVQRVLDHAEAMDRWQAEMAAKVPDLPSGA